MFARILGARLREPDLLAVFCSACISRLASRAHNIPPDVHLLPEDRLQTPPPQATAPPANAPPPAVYCSLCLSRVASPARITSRRIYNSRRRIAYRHCRCKLRLYRTKASPPAVCCSVCLSRVASPACITSRRMSTSRRRIAYRRKPRLRKRTFTCHPHASTRKAKNLWIRPITEAPTPRGGGGGLLRRICISPTR